MITTDQHGREVEFEVSGEEDDVTISWMIFTDTGEDADEETIEWVEENRQDKLFEAWFENQVDRVDYLYG